MVRFSIPFALHPYLFFVSLFTVRKRQSPARAAAFVQFADTASAAAAREAAGLNWGRPGEQQDVGTEEGVVVAGTRVRANWALPKMDTTPVQSTS